MEKPLSEIKKKLNEEKLKKYKLLFYYDVFEDELQFYNQDTNDSIFCFQREEYEYSESNQDTIPFWRVAPKNKVDSIIENYLVKKIFTDNKTKLCRHCYSRHTKDFDKIADSLIISKYK